MLFEVLGECCHGGSEETNLKFKDMKKSVKKQFLPKTMAVRHLTENERMELKRAIEQRDDRDEFEDELLEQFGSGSFPYGDDDEAEEDCYGSLCASFWINGWPVTITVEAVDPDSIFRLLLTLFRGEA